MSLTLRIKIDSDEPLSEHDRALLEWGRERHARGLPFSDVHWVDDDGNEVPPPTPVSFDEWASSGE